MSGTTLLTLAVLFGGSACILQQVMQEEPEIPVRHYDDSTEGRQRDWEIRAAGDAEKRGDAKAAAYYHRMVAGATVDSHCLESHR